MLRPLKPYDAWTRTIRFQIAVGGVDDLCACVHKRGQDQRVGHGKTVAMRNTCRAPHLLRVAQPQDTADMRQRIQKVVGFARFGEATKTATLKFEKRDAGNKRVLLRPGCDLSPNGCRAGVLFEKPDKESRI